MSKNKRRTYYDELPKQIIAIKVEHRGYDITIVNKKHIVKYYIKSLFNYICRNKKDFYLERG